MFIFQAVDVVSIFDDPNPLPWRIKIIGFGTIDEVWQLQARNRCLQGHKEKGSICHGHSPLPPFGRELKNLRSLRFSM